MSTDKSTPNKAGAKKISLVALAIAGVLIGGIGAWRYLQSSKKGPTAAETKPVGSRPASFVDAPERAVEAPPLTGAQEDVARKLREKLNGSLEDFLRALSELAKTQPALALDLAHQLGRTDDEKIEWVKNVMQQWADADPQKAWQWLREQPFKKTNDMGGGDLPQVVMGTMAARDPNMLLANIDTLLRHGNLTDGVSTPVAVHVGVQALIDHDKTDIAKSAVESWARDPRKLELGEAAYSTVAMALAKDAPEQTAQWLKSLPQSDDRNVGFSSLAAVWAESNPTAALKWAETLGPNEARNAVIGRTVSDWVERYPNEVAGWLGNYLARAPADENSDRLVETVLNISPAVKNNPQTALQWTELISDPAKRVAYEGNVALRWGRQDPGAAIAYVQKSATLPQEQKIQIVQRIQNKDFSGISEE